MKLDWNRINWLGYRLEEVLGLLALFAAASLVLLEVLVQVERRVPDHVWTVVACEQDATVETRALLQLAGDTTPPGNTSAVEQQCSEPPAGPDAPAPYVKSAPH